MIEDSRLVRRDLKKITFTDGHVKYIETCHVTVLDTGERFVEPFGKKTPSCGILTPRHGLSKRNGEVKEV